MTWSFTTWSPDDSPGEVHKTSKPEIWDRLLDYYTNSNGNRALARVFTIARDHGVVSVVCERRYIDADWRSQHARFYNGTFVAIPPCATGCISSPDKYLRIWLNSATCKMHTADTRCSGRCR